MSQLRFFRAARREQSPRGKLAASQEVCGAPREIPCAEQKSYTRNIPGNHNRKLAHQLPRVAHSAHNREKSRRQLRALAWPQSKRLRSSQAHLRRSCTPPSVFSKTEGVSSSRV